LNHGNWRVCMGIASGVWGAVERDISREKEPAPWGWPGIVQQTVQIAASRDLTLIVRRT